MREQRIRVCACALAATALLRAQAARAEDVAPPRTIGERAWSVAEYLPNRLFDLCDVVRLHVRVGTGFAAGGRVTRSLPVFVGDYRAVWVGLPGPRGRAKLPLPAGAEGEKGVEVASMRVGSGSKAPEYGVGEIGAGVMIYVVGVEIGVDPYEFVDFLAGFAGVDLAHDDF